MRTEPTESLAEPMDIAQAQRQQYEEVQHELSRVSQENLRLKAENERLRECLVNVVNTSGRTRELVRAEELLAATATPNEDE